MKRFYRKATVAERDGGWRVLLDGRGIKTQGRGEQILPGRALAEWLAGEWASQGEEIDPAAFPARDLADYAIDHVARDRDAAIAHLLRYAETDTLCYRADPDEPLFARQEEVWEPLLSGFEMRHDLRFERISGIVHRPQPEATMRRLEALLQTHNAFTLAALGTLASLSASLAIALLTLEPGSEAESLWAAANLEEDWQAGQWGWDALAQERRTRRLGDFSQAMHFAGLALSG